MQPSLSVKTFATRPLGRAVLLAAAIVLVGFSFVYLGELPAILVMLVFGLALPIYMGWKRVRHLALAGLVILLIAGPIASALLAQELRVPSPIASSTIGGAYGTGGAVLQNGSVDPFVSDGARNFTFSVTVVPAHLPNATGRIGSVVLFVSTCPYDTSAEKDFCGGSVENYTQTIAFPGGLNSTRTVQFSQRLSAPAVWWFQIYAVATNATGNVTNIFLAPGTSYATIEGPVTGDFFSTMGITIGSIYLSLFFYLGIVFYIGLLGYYYFKLREQRRLAATGGAPGAGASGAAATKSGPGAASAPLVEIKCPKCQAIVYPSESNCWKCGAPLPKSGEGEASPLPSAPP